MIKALIVTVAYNPSDSLLDNLKVDYYPHMVVDNSEQETFWLKEYCLLHNHVYQWLGENLGIAKALNVGADYAAANGYDYIITMDQDSTLTNDLLIDMKEKVTTFPNVGEIAIFSPKHIIYESDGKVASLEAYSEDITKTMTSGNWVNLKIWQSIGVFDENLFIDGVDMEYYLRAKISNYKIITFLDVFMKHNLGSDCSNHKILKYRFDASNHSPLRRYYMMRNYLYLIRKYRKNIEKIPEIRIYYKVTIKLPITILLFESDKFKKLKYILFGCLDFLRGKYGKFTK